MQGFPLKMTERDSWSGPEDGGYWVFDSLNSRNAYLEQIRIERAGRSAPEFYVQYETCPAIELTLPHKFDKQGKFYADKLVETRTIPLV